MTAGVRRLQVSPDCGSIPGSEGKTLRHFLIYDPGHGSPRRRRHPFVRLLTAAAAVLATLLLAPGAAAIPSDTPDPTWGANARVSAIVQSGNIVYLGGSFTELREKGGAGPAVLQRTYLAALDATTGAPLAGWAPTLNGAVYALALSPDGKRLYAGGAFTSVDGVARYRIAAVDAATGKLDTTWKPAGPAADVTAIAAMGSRVYIGGYFKTVGGQNRDRLAALSATTGALDSGWAPAADLLVRALAFSADGTRLLAGGDFTTVSGQARKNVVALDPVTGAVFADWQPNPGYPIFALGVTDTTVYGAGGGSANTLVAWNATTGAVKWSKRGDGDFQALAVSGDMVYAGGHFNYFEGELRRKLVAVDGRTGALRRDWNPILPATETTWGGVWGMSAWGGTRLTIGGDFDSVTGVRQERYAQFTGSLNGASGDTTPPTTPTNLRGDAIGGSRVDLAWSASTDNDGIAEYRVFRNGAQIATAGTTNYSDTTVRPSTTYTYHVVAADFAGNTSSSSGAATVTTAPPDETVTFAVTDDAYVASAAPDANYGSATSVAVDADPVKNLLLKFNVSGISGREIVSAKLRLYCVDGSTNGGDFRRISNTSWSEANVTWNNAPAGDPLITSVLSDPAAKKWYDVDITPLVTGDGAVSVRVTSVSSNGAAYSSKEGGVDFAPRLVVTLADKSAKLAPRRVFSDGFESGDLSRWTSATGLRAQQAEVSSGAWAARATSSGLAAYALRQLPTSYSELYTQLRVKPLSQGANTVVLQRLATGTGASLLRLYLTSTGALAYRNDVAGTSATSSSTVSQGSWHTIAVHAVVNGTAGQIEVWLDGRRLDALSKTESLGTAPIGRINVGDDATGKSFGVVFDDVVVDRVPLDGSPTADTSPPTTPTGLTATAVSSGRVDLAWNAATDNVGVTGYEVYRNGTLLAKVGTVTSYADTAASAGTSYSYEVRATDAAGNRSAPSNTATVTTPPQGDAGAPSAPTGATATAVSFDRVDLSWAASTDDVGVTGYTIYRDGSRLATVDGATTRYRDTTVAAGTSYSYTVAASDAAGNVSAASAPATVTTPPRTVFFEGFESGDLSQWTTSTGLVVQAGERFAGKWGARATSTGVATYAEKQLGASYADLSSGLRLKVVSQAANSFSLLKFRTAAGTSVVRLYVTSTGYLAYRNDVAGTIMTSTTAVSPGVWHTARVRVVINGSASQIEVWFNGSKVAALSKTEPLGTTAIGRVQLGENATAKTYDVVFDDVTVDAPPANSSSPTISGTARERETLTAEPGTWSGTQPLDYAYQWHRCDALGAGCTDIVGATGKSYTLTSADVGATVRVTVKASNVAGASTATSDATAAVAPALP